MSPVVVASRCVFDGTGDVSPSALLIDQGYIQEVFPYSALEQLAQTYEVHDFGDALITPGLHDAHQHVLHAALFPSALADEHQSTSLANCLERLCAFSKTAPRSGWLLSHGWRDNLWTDGGVPHKSHLDTLFPDRPVALYSGDSHTLWVNSCGLKTLGITDATEPPEGGIFDRDTTGELTGVLREAAGMKYVAQIMRTMDTDLLQQVYADYFDRLLSFGITSVCDMAISLIPGSDGILPEVYTGLLKDNKLKIRAHVFPTLTEDTSNIQDIRSQFEAKELLCCARKFGDASCSRTGEQRTATTSTCDKRTQDLDASDALCATPFANSMLQAPGFKQFFDGVSSQHTAWVFEDYENARFKGDQGHPTVEPSRMRDLVFKAAVQGNAVRIHAIGDKAVHSALDIMEAAQVQYGKPRFGVNTIEHVEDCIPADIERFSALGVVASVQPPHITIDVTQPARDLGECRAARMWPLDRMERSGVTLALGTDAPVVSPNSLDVLWCATKRSHPVTHAPQAGWYPSHALSRIQALCAYTAGSAAAVGRSESLGTLACGKLADLVVWDHNLLTCADEELQDVRPAKVYVGGVLVYEKGNHE